MRKLSMAFLVLATVALFIGVSSNFAIAKSTTWTVDDDGVECPTADFTHPQDAVNATNPGDTILVNKDDRLKDAYSFRRIFYAGLFHGDYKIQFSREMIIANRGVASRPIWKCLSHSRGLFS